MTSDPEESNRGIFTDADRDYLSAPDGYSRQAAHSRRRAIERRTENAMRDFWFLAHRAEDRTVERIADDLVVDGEFHPVDPVPPELADRDRAVIEGVDPSHVRAAPGGFHRGVADSVAFLFRLYGDDEEMFERVLAEGVRAGVAHMRGGTWSVSVSIDADRVEGFDLDAVIEKLENAEYSELTDFERKILIARLGSKDAIDFDALRETSFENESPPERTREPMDKFRERLPIEHELARLRDPQKQPDRRGS